ncbi:MAG: hypothetical protein ACR2LN_03580 [Candidatus Levyibacteriota bacterium]
MYYTFSCPYCNRLFYTFNDNKEQAAEALYAGIEAHMQSYGEDDKEHTFNDQLPETETNQIYASMGESSQAPSGGYQL